MQYEPVGMQTMSFLFGLIRIFSYKRITALFKAKKFRDRRSNEEIEVLPENGGGDNNSNSELEDEITVSSGSNAVSEIEIENDRVVPEEAEAADLNSESLNVRMLVLVKRRLMKKTRQMRGSGKGNGLCYGDKERKMGFVMVKEEGKGKV
ncbi:hypothetical protein FF2_016058 [Malus domestica]